MIRHPRRSTPATIVAVVLLTVCVLTVVSVVQSLLDQAPLISLTTLLGVSSSQQWNSALTITAAIVVAVLGLVLLMAAIRPGKPTVMPLVGEIGGRPASSAGVRRRTLAKDLSAAAAAVPGVSRASVSARRSRVVARLSVAAADPGVVPDQVRDRLEQRLGEIGPAPRPRVRVRARRDSST